jgi:beta-galactosidase/beta-glucuronidase
MAWEKVKMGWLRRTVKIPSNWGSKEIYLHFEAVAGYADVYINGVKVGENFDIFLPFDIDITKYASPGNKLEIMVGVRSQQLFENNHTVGRRILPAGSMWGQHIIGIWQDVYLTAKPKINVTNLFVKPLVGLKQLLIQVSLENNTNISSSISVDGDVYEWLNHAGTDVVSAPEPNWELGKKTASITHRIVVIKPYGKQTVTLTLRVADNMLNEWTPEHPNLYALLLSLKQGSYTIDMKYERFGWREWTINGTQYCLNGKPYPLRGDSWHFMGIPQMTRRYAWAWYHTLKDINGNAVRLHAQVYPRFYMDMADEMGICVLDETANWASDGGPKLDSDTFWSKSKEHLNRFVLRDRNYPSVFGWSISNENKPVILYVYKKPELLVPQKKAWQEWCGIVKSTDPTRPWISSDGEDDGDGVLPVTVGHYGDSISMAHWRAIGKPWGVGEHSMAYYGTPEQVSVYNGEQAFVSQKGRMEGLANECYNLITVQRKNGAAYSSVFNMVWYAL